jgi:hypothetical protein
MCGRVARRTEHKDPRRNNCTTPIDGRNQDKNCATNN